MTGSFADKVGCDSVFINVLASRALGAIILLPIVIGILVFHITIEPSGLIMSIVMLGINAWIIADNKDRYLPMLG